MAVPYASDVPYVPSAPCKQQRGSEIHQTTAKYATACAAHPRQGTAAMCCRWV